MSNFNNEPTNDKIEDYNGKESPEKRNIVRLVVILILIIGAFFAYLKTTSLPSDYIGTPENPGINTSKN
ncbi:MULTISPECIES: hypothetical protein [Arcobacteraceae]|uniref:Uncharacterized protein n=1 Tax=Poseidonibacter parvus TaxID=1850254 RepID=A0A1P8KL27_9BACT|nr:MULTISPECIES: hypothetical protein [Arcobacteraceae]APW65235.1 hypothetical protein LPB137_04935 [Poseidonibacter parvus]